MLVWLSAVAGASAGWLEFVDETSTRLVAGPGLGNDDFEEKDFAWGDVDKDGDIDLVVVRKEPFTSAGKRVNVLFLNEGGVLTDRTTAFATASDVAGDAGFNTPTNDRDVKLVDVNDDSWLDIVTATTISDGDPKHIGHPRIYLNLGNDGNGDWLGFSYFDALIPTMLTYSGLSGFNPRFCSVVAGDLTGDTLPELWFGDYDSSGAAGNEQPPGADFNDRLLVNGPIPGRYRDATLERISGLIQIPTGDDTTFEVTAFGAAGVIDDMNGDGVNDIVKQTALNAPQYVGISYNEVDNEGFFDDHEVVYSLAPYFVSAGDLNNDNRLDLVITDDGADRYLINTGNDADGHAQFVSQTFSFDYTADGDQGFGSNSIIDDLDGDGWNDVIIADVDVDEAGCDRRTQIYRNLGGNPGDPVILEEQSEGSACGGANASCMIAGIPADQLNGVHDVAVFDLNDDGFKDLILGRCDGTSIWIQVPPVGLSFSFPAPPPTQVEPGTTTDFEVDILAVGGAQIAPGSAKLFSAINGGAFVESALVSLGGTRYRATLPAATNCLDTIDYYLSVDSVAGGNTLEPEAGAAGPSRATAYFDIETILFDDIEGITFNWTVQSDASLTSGTWEAAVPNGTLTNGGQQAAPDGDAEPDPAVTAWVTQNGPVGGSSGADDVDGGPTILISPSFDLAGRDGIVSYARWMFSSGDDVMTVAVSGDGSSWVDVETVAGDQNAWTTHSFRVGEFIVPSATTQVRFSVSDNPNNSVVEAGVDAFKVDAFVCAECVIAADCDDGNFCNGAETCDGTGRCQPGVDACAGQACDEVSDTCVECIDDIDCDDGTFCNGAEVCSGNTCIAGTDPCPGSVCDEGLDTCVDCVGDGDCDDGLFCNGAETCNGGVCSGPVDACPGQTCDESGDVCVGSIALQPRMGDPIDGLSPTELDRFLAGRARFNQVLTDANGLGPIFNQNSCASCHNNPIGGSGAIRVTRFGWTDPKSGSFDPLNAQGGSLLQAETIDPACAESIPPVSNVSSLRVTNSALGFGLVEAIPDAALIDLESNPPAGVSGKAHMVEALEAPGIPRVGRFGWKSQVATVLTFSADAAQNEMGLTNRLLPNENAPNGDLLLLSNCDTVPDPEDQPDGQGMEFIDRVTDFQRFLAPPPQTPRSGMAGEAVFNAIACNSCHVRSFSTPDDPQLEPALRNKVLRPYSDFLLHDMGQNADFIGDGAATPRELRTAPLWGLRVRDPLWHDGRVAGGTFDGRMRDAIAQHDSLGSEGSSSAQSFAALPLTDQTALIAFLDSLGRAEFDHDGDGDVDIPDYQAFNACFTGPGNFLTADDPCAVSDVDRDGDVDADDRTLFLLAVSAPAGAIASTHGGAQPPLTMDKQAGEMVLNWGRSCIGQSEYAIYEGTIGDFTSHTPRACSTGGLTTETLSPPAFEAYYIIVPRNALREGSYGQDSGGLERPAASSGACAVQELAVCPP